MEIWRFNDPEPLRPFFRVLEAEAPHLLGSARRLLETGSVHIRLDLCTLANGLVHRSTNVRRTVQSLLFSPPVEDELGHFRRLSSWLFYWLPPGWHEDISVCRSVVEMAASAGGSAWLPVATALETALKQRRRSWRNEVAHLFATCQPASRRLLIARLARRLPRAPRPGLRRRLLEADELSLGQIYQAIDKARRYPPAGALRVCRKRIFPAVLTGKLIARAPSSDACWYAAPSLNSDLRILSWGGRRPEEILSMEKLISYQTNELIEVFTLAREVSRRTGRVVVTLHNASLGAATGWGIPSFAQQVPDGSKSGFAERVESLRRACAGNPTLQDKPSRSSKARPGGDHAGNLFHLWSRRLVRPRLLLDLWNLRVSLLLNDLPTAEWEELLGQTGELLEDEDRSRLYQGKNLAIAFESPPSCRRHLQETLSWYHEKKESQIPFLSMLWSLLAAGEEWLRTGQTPYLVLPVIDKFFISSQRDQDLDYLPLFVHLAEVKGHSPIFLLIDDTSRSSHPSLQLAMEGWRTRHAFLGLGIFASADQPAPPTLEEILARLPGTRLFALRPLDHGHNPVSLESLLSQGPRDFLTPGRYDPSWKDNLPFLYQGTQVTPLAGPARQVDRYPPVVITSSGPLPFGTYYRLKLRRLALDRLGFLTGEEMADRRHPSPLESLWQEYSRMANLC